MSVKLLGAGIYHGAEVARLVHRDRDTIARWTVERRNIPALVTPQLGGLFSFHDLISLYVISELRRRSVRRREIYEGGRYLQRELGTDRPYAHRRLATVGSAFFAEVGEWVDAGKGGQKAFQAVIRPLLRPIDYDDESGMAEVWRPHPLIALNPLVQAGTPCIEGTRVPTATVARLIISEDDDPDEVAEDFGLTPQQLAAAVDWEIQLDRAPAAA